MVARPVIFVDAGRAKPYSNLDRKPSWDYESEGMMNRIVEGGGLPGLVPGTALPRRSSPLFHEAPGDFVQLHVRVLRDRL